MKHLVMTCLMAVAITSSALASESKAIRDVVNTHFKGIITGNEALLKSVWDLPNASLTSATKVKGKEIIRNENFPKAIEKWTKKAHKSSKGTILSVDVVNARMSNVKANFVWNGVEFTDYLVLFKVNNKWKIVSKFYTNTKKTKKLSPYGAF
ncbi:MAG: nuclear transport factor 2 family protein [Lentisphaeria bacterium]|nr:nuclear transport factor 2 family protein [Lentisphaeria bacterium]NQZ68229.1 nuclear transport factor 2 family protein [Lentisphaeria bacterium]